MPKKEKWMIIAATKSGRSDIIEELKSHSFEWTGNCRESSRDGKEYVWRNYKCSKCGAKVWFTRLPEYRPINSNIEFRIECSLGRARMNFCQKN